MAITAAELKAIITADTSQAQNSLENFNNSLDSLGKGNALSSLSGAFTNIGETMMGVSLIGDGMFTGSIVAAADYEKNLAILGAIENSTMARNKDMQVVQAGYVNVTNMSTEAIRGLTKERDSEQISLDKLTRQYENGSNRTKSAAQRIQELKIDIADLNGKLNEGTQTHKIWQNGMEVGTAVTHMSREAIDQFANELEKTTRFSKEQTIASIMMGETFTSIGADLMPQATLAAMNLSTVFGRDLRTSVIMVDKALQEPVRGVDNLRRIGVQFSDAQKTMIQNFMNQNNLAAAQAIIMHELTIELGGAAEAAGDTMAGKMDQLGNAFKRVFQEMGSNMLPGLEDLMGGITNFIVEMKPAITAVLQFVMGISLVGTIIGAALIILGAFLSPIGLIVTGIGTIGLAFEKNFGGIGKFLNDVKIDIQTFANDIGDIIKPVIDALSFQMPEDQGTVQTVKTKRMNEEGGLYGPQNVKQQEFVQDNPMEAYVKNLLEQIKIAGGKIKKAFEDFVDALKTDFEFTLRPALDKAFIALFGVDLDTAFKPIKTAWDIIQQYFGTIISDFQQTVTNLQKLDLAPIVLVLGVIGGAFILFGAALKAAGILMIAEGIKNISDGFVKLQEAVKLMKEGNTSEGLKKLGDAIGPLGGGILLVAGGIALLSGVINAAFIKNLTLFVANAIVTGVSGLGISFGGLAVGLWAAISPILLIGVGIIALIAAMELLFGKKKDFIGAIEEIAGVLKGVLVDAITIVLTSMLGFMTTVQRMLEAIGDTANAAKWGSAIADVTQTIMSLHGDTAGTGHNPVTGMGFNTPPANFSLPQSVTNPPVAPPLDIPGYKGGKQNTNQININNVNVNNVRNPAEIYNQVIDEANRRNAPMKTRNNYA